MIMAIDYLIGTLIAASTLVNALALGAFWITPGLRTTANRFVINLLIVNLVGCVALTPSLFGGWTTSGEDRSHLMANASAKGSGDAMGNVSSLEALLNGTVRELIDLDADIERAVELVSEAVAVAAFIEGTTEDIHDGTSRAELSSATTWSPKGDDDAAVPIERVQRGEQRSGFGRNTRHWGFDLTAALGESRVPNQV